MFLIAACDIAGALYMQQQSFSGELLISNRHCHDDMSAEIPEAVACDIMLPSQHVFDEAVNLSLHTLRRSGSVGTDGPV